MTDQCSFQSEGACGQSLHSRPGPWNEIRESHIPFISLQNTTVFFDKMTMNNGNPVMTEFQKAKFAGSRAICLQTNLSITERKIWLVVVSENSRELI